MSSKLADQVKDAGVIGAGGAGFPAHVKLGKPVDTVIVNGAECEPMMFGDQHVMESRTDEVLAGLKMIVDDFSQRLDKPTRAVIGVKAKYKKAIAAFRERINGDPIEILELPNVYPSGDEQFLVHEATGRIVPEGGIPPMVNALVSNVGTLAQIAAAVSGKPVTDRIMTLGGAVANPCVVNVPIGTPFSQIVPKLGPLFDDYVILVNGPMMGRITTDLGEVTTKTMGGLFVLPKKHSHVYRMSRPLNTEIKLSKSACEVCRYCTDFCPRYLQGHSLEPHKIMRVINYDRDLDTKTITSAWLCCECGVCDLWACPMFLSPRVIFKEFKKRLKESNVAYSDKRENLEIDEHRKFRGVPTDRLVRRMELSEYDKRPPFISERWETPVVKIGLAQHIGAPAQPVVSEGQEVKLGEPIAAIPDNALGAAYHASIGGTVSEIGPHHITIERS